MSRSCGAGDRARRLRRAVMGVVATALAAVALAAPGDQRQQNERITLYYGVMPTALAQVSLAPHASALDVHGAVRVAPDSHHLVVALFDTPTGQRITEATVIVRHIPPHGDATSKVLEPMTIGETKSFGTTFDVAPGRDHQFRIEVRRGAAVDRFDVVYDNLHRGP